MANRRLKGKKTKDRAAPTGLISAQHAFDAGESIGLRAGYRDLFGQATTWVDIRDDLSHVGGVLDVLGRISAVLDNAGQNEAAMQTTVAAGLLGPAASDLLQRAEKFSRGTTNPTVVLFEPLQLVFLAKAALLVLPADGTLRSHISYERRSRAAADERSHFAHTP